MSTEDEFNAEEASEEEEAGEEEEIVTPVAAAPPARKAPSKKRSVGKVKGIAAVAAAGGQQAAPTTSPAGQQWPTDGEQLWDAIVSATNDGALVSYGAQRPGDWKIDVTRSGLGPMPSPPVKMQSIDGGAVGGSDQRTPGEMLYDYLAELYHPLAPGMARYDLQFTVKRRTTFKRGSIDMPAPAELAQQRARVAQHAQMTAAGPLGAPGGVAMPQRPIYPAHGFGAPPQQAIPAWGQQPSPYYPQQPDMGTRDSVDAMRREVAMLLGRIDEASRQQAEVAARPAQINVGTSPQAPTVPPEDFETRVARVVLTTLGALGVGPAAKQPAAPAVGVAAPPVAPAAQGIGSVVEKAREHMSGLKEIVGIMREFRELDQGFRPAIEEPEEREEVTPIAAVPAVIEDATAFKVRPVPFSESQLNNGKTLMWVEKIDGEGTAEWLTRMGAANPDATMNVLQIGMRLLDQISIGQVLKQWMERGGPMGQAAAQVAAATPASGVAAPPNGAGTAVDGSPYPPA
jgi:hypothetical protein